MLRELVAEAGEGADVIAELGIGLNPAVKPRGHVMLDEKAAHTAHVAIGKNTGSYGGRQRRRHPRRLHLLGAGAGGRRPPDRPLLGHDLESLLGEVAIEGERCLDPQPPHQFKAHEVDE